MQLFDGHVATIKAVIIQIKLNRFVVKKISKTISSHLKPFSLDFMRNSYGVIHLYLGKAYFLYFHAFFIRTSKFWPSFVVLMCLHKLSLNCS